MVTVRRPRITFLLPDALKKLTTIKMNSELEWKNPLLVIPPGWERRNLNKEKVATD
jgi:hypothetical protein